MLRGPHKSHNSGPSSYPKLEIANWPRLKNILPIPGTLLLLSGHYFSIVATTMPIRIAKISCPSKIMANRASSFILKVLDRIEGAFCFTFPVLTKIQVPGKILTPAKIALPGCWLQNNLAQASIRTYFPSDIMAPYTRNKLTIFL